MKDPNCLPNFLKLNVIPVIVHQEDEDKLVTFLKEKNLQSLKVSKEDLINFGNEDASCEDANSNPEDFVSNLLYPNLKEMIMKARDPNQP
ncbi:hypothetical protein ABK040_012501 [Willaertia magna]